MIPLKNGEFDISTFFELTLDLVCIAGKDGYFRKVNSAVINKLEYSEEELMQSLISSFIHPEDRELTHEKRQKLLNGEALINFQNRYVSKSGKIIWLHWTSVYFPDQEVVFAIAKDVTEKKLIELEMEERYREFKSLARYFKGTMERDKKYFALELHEELAQLASMIKMNIDWLDSHLSGLSESEKSRMEQIAILSGQMIRTIRKMAFTISPGMLEDLGLIETMTWLCHEFSDIKGIPCHFESILNSLDLSNEVTTDIFRMCQEVLRHIVTSSKVNAIKIQLGDKANKAILKIIIEGREIDISLEKDLLELTGIRERVATLNGHLFISSDKKKGMVVKVTVPLPMEEGRTL
jgi:PAS domain S-box-containing protein